MEKVLQAIKRHYGNDIQISIVKRPVIKGMVKERDESAR